MAEINQIRGLGIHWRAEASDLGAVFSISRNDVTFQTGSFIWVNNGDDRIEPLDFLESAAVDALIETRDIDKFKDMDTDSAGVQQYVLDVAANNIILLGVSKPNLDTLFSIQHKQNSDLGTNSSQYIINKGHPSKQATIDSSTMTQDMTFDLQKAISFLEGNIPVVNSASLPPQSGSVAFIFLDTNVNNPGITFFDPVRQKLVNGLNGKEI